MIQLKITNHRKVKPGAILAVLKVTQENPKLIVVEAREVDFAQSIIVYKGPKDVDWSRIADMISEGYESG